jgi:hypothetical protein
MLNRVMEVQVSDTRLNGVHRGGQRSLLVVLQFNK